MPGVLGYVIVTGVLVLVVALAVRSVWKSHKKAGRCNGDCSRCGGCH